MFTFGGCSSVSMLSLLSRIRLKVLVRRRWLVNGVIGFLGGV